MVKGLSLSSQKNPLDVTQFNKELGTNKLIHRVPDEIIYDL